MSIPIQISYRHDLLTIVGTDEVKSGTAEVVTELIVNAAGTYNATRYNTQTDSEETLSGRADDTLFEYVTRFVSDSLLNPDLANRISTELVGQDTKEVNRVTLQKFYEGGFPKQEAIYIWDMSRYFLQIPEEMTTLQLAMAACIEELHSSRG